MYKTKQLILVLFLVLGLVSICLADSTVRFEWDANSETDLAGYRLYQSATPGSYVYGKGNEVAEIPAGTAELTLSNVPDGDWSWVLTAFDTHGNESGPSNEVGANLDTEAPKAPSFRLISVEINR